ncbi:ATP-dependent nuclease [Chryseobacterium rhizosphaerae]|uniref:ATP-dependent nuclease n=1 Tax=Chryseobacterium rhizosphaerae TaxID=395937 RepID=UPI003D0CE81C
MKIKKLEIKNFRLLKNIELSLEEKSTVIVGRNNSGKTSLTEIFRRLLSDKTPSFSLYDFNISSIENFKEALILHLNKEEQVKIRKALPIIEIKFTIEYNPDNADLGLLGDFIIDLNPESTTVVIIIKYQLQDGKIDTFFNGIPDDSPESISEFLKNLKERIPQFHEVKVFAQDPNDETNIASMEYSKFKSLLGTGFINAQRGLDDITHTEKDVLGKVLSKLFKTANITTAPADMKEKSEALNNVIKEIQQTVDTEFNGKLDKLLPALELFGYQGLVDPKLSTETVLDVANILDSHTKIRYSQGNGLFLPETYNGLGSRNLIYILFQLFEFFRDWQSRPIANSLYIVFIEEPEAHLHPQMQQVFIKQLNEIVNEFSKTLNNNIPWPVQFVVTTHSTHIANEAKFDAIRYFLTSKNEQRETRIKDLRKEFVKPELQADKEFLHKYLTLTKCDLYFADKAILIEGPTERILMPVIIEKIDLMQNDTPKLSPQYISVIEVGGAYAHHFYKFLDFLELRTIVITDLDSVKYTVIKDKNNNDRTTYPSNQVDGATHSSNSGIKNWFDKDAQGYISLADLMAKTSEQKISGFRRIAYQIPEIGKACCARSYEDAFMLANIELCALSGNNDIEQALNAYKNTPTNDEKTDFALKYALEVREWNVPQYLVEGLQWLAQHPNIPAQEVQEEIENVIEETK